MSSDFSRSPSASPLLDFAAVLHQQGRVTTDRDFNEQALTVERALRALASDVLGWATVSQTTPNAFRLEVSGNSLTIGVGRMYVHGLRAENHGYAESTVAFDDLLAEPVFTGATPLDAQPHMPVPQKTPERGKFLVYLDVWQREVTHLQVPDLVDVALGVDTSTRLQTVWQVKLLASDDPLECGTPDAQIPGWAELIAPSTGRLTTGTYDVPAADDPCELPPTGGYRGLENQLYRVEVHGGGHLGPDGATFKWSRENRSVKSLVSDIISFKELELDSLGRDEVLGLKSGDWVEILDDTRELSRKPGEMRRITVTNETRRLTLDSDLPTELCGQDFRDLHLRVVRWEHARQVLRTDANGPPVPYHDLDANMNGPTHGAIPVPPAGTELLLEHGVKVSFSEVPGNGQLNPGDFWHFAARTADATVEILTDAPPRGIHHHYARLGVWTVGTGVTDCREKWPPAAGDGHDCGCVACVTAESYLENPRSIQDAVDRAQAAGGGTVCIGPGDYSLERPIEMIGMNAVRIRGAGWTTRLLGEGVIVAQSCSDIALENLTLIGRGERPAVSIHSGFGVTLRGLLVVHLARPVESAPAAIALRGALGDVRITENFIVAPVGIRANDRTAGPPLPPALVRNLPMLGALEIEKNRFTCGIRAIDLATDVFWVAATRIADNDVVASEVCAIQAVGQGLTGSSLSITGNNLNVPGAGIRAGGRTVRVSDNVVTTPKPTEPADSRHVGIQIVQDGRSKAVEACEVASNRVSGFFTGIAFGQVTELLVKLNAIDDCCNGIVQDSGARQGSVSIENNHLSAVGGRADNVRNVLGISVSRVDTCTVAHNSIRAFGSIARIDLQAAIATFGAARVRVSGNELLGIAAGEFLGRCVGILIRGPYDDFLVSDNRVERDGESPLTTTNASSDWTALSVEESPGVFDVRGPAATEMGVAMLRLDTARVLVFGGGTVEIRDYAADPDPGAPEPSRAPSGSVLGNALRARGRSGAVDVASTRECLFSDNRVELVGGAPAAVLLTPRGAAIVNANRVRGGEPSIHVGSSARFTVLGNVTTGGIRVGVGDLADPWAALNVRDA